MVILRGGNTGPLNSWNNFRLSARDRHAQHVAANAPLPHATSMPDITCTCKCNSLAHVPCFFPIFWKSHTRLAAQHPALLGPSSCFSPNHISNK